MCDVLCSDAIEQRFVYLCAWSFLHLMLSLQGASDHFNHFDYQIIVMILFTFSLVLVILHFVRSAIGGTDYGGSCSVHLFG